MLERSSKYEHLDVMDIAWRTLLCNHAQSLGGGFPDEYLKHFQCWWNVMRFQHFPKERPEYFKAVVQKIQEEHPQYEGKDPEEILMAFRPGILSMFEGQKRLANEFETSMLRFCQTHCLTAGVKGYVGMTPASTRRDDAVV
jgi:hypothetical protein